MSKHKYGMQKSIQNNLQQCINSFERMKRGGIGIADECVEDTCKRALKYIDALEAKLAESEPVRHGHWYWCEEPHNSFNDDGFECGWKCSCCNNYPDHDNYMADSYENKPNLKYCPNCGAKMDGDKNDT